MRAIWSGLISFGLVSIPIELYPATKKRSVSFHQLHDTCHSRIEYLKYCPKDNLTVSDDEIIRGYEYEKGRYVMVSDEELEKINPKLTRSIEILDFVKAEEVDPIFFEKSYFLAPKPESEKAFSLLAKGLKNKKKVAIARMVVKNKQHLALIREKDGMLDLETLFFSDEIRGKQEIESTIGEVEQSQKEVQLAEDLIDRMTDKFDPSKYHDEYREELQAMIQEKVEGKEIVAPEVVEAKVMDLMTALKESVEQVKRGKKKEKVEEKKELVTVKS